jgi:hypothetical protein
VGRLGNFLSLQAGWFACVLGAAHGREWIGPAVALGLFALHLSRHPAPRAELRLALVVTPLGWIVDSAQRAAGWIDYAGWLPLGVLAPLWIASLWTLFATTFGSSLAWLVGRPWLALVFGALGGPLSYLGAERLGAVVLGADRGTSLAGLALTWGLAMPALLALAQRLGRRFA